MAGIALIGFIIFNFTARTVDADLFGGDVAVLTQILVQAIDQVYKLQSILGKAKETVQLLEEMNRGVKEVLKLAETAHIPLPPGVYDQAKKIDQAVIKAQQIYGVITDKSPPYMKTHYQSGVEGLHLSQDTFDYSTFLDEQGESVKKAAVLASQASATRLTAETLGVVLHSISHSNRIQAKSLEITSSNRLEESAKDSARYDSFINTHTKIEEDVRKPSFSSLNGMEF
jgi:hypothetical protein